MIAYIADILAILWSRGWPIAVLFRLLPVQAKSAVEEFGNLEYILLLFKREGFTIHLKFIPNGRLLLEKTTLQRIHRPVATNNI